MSRPDASSTGLQNRAIESDLFESGRPILISPPSPPRQIATNVLVAWNCSTEQARATAFAMPLLQQADRVTVLTVELNGKTTGEAILATANSLGCDLLIKGAYTQSRLRQMIFGGATRHVLANAALPVLLAH